MTPLKENHQEEFIKLGPRRYKMGGIRLGGSDHFFRGFLLVLFLFLMLFLAASVGWFG